LKVKLTVYPTLLSMWITAMLSIWGEKDKKRRVEFYARREATQNDVAQLTSKELEVLLWWKGVAASKMGNVANRQLII